VIVWFINQLALISAVVAVYHGRVLPEGGKQMLTMYTIGMAGTKAG